MSRESRPLSLHARTRDRALAVAAVVAVAGLVVSSASTAVATSSVGSSAPTDREALYLVTLRGAGSSGSTALVPRRALESAMLAEQDDLLRSVDGGPVVYRWTTALNGFAARLTAAQADDLAASDQVSLVERDDVRPLAAAPSRGLDGSGVGGARARPRGCGHDHRRGRHRAGDRQPALRPHPPERTGRRVLRLRDRARLAGQRLQRQGRRRPMVRRRLRARPPALPRHPVPRRHRRTRHPDGLDRRRQLTRAGARGRRAAGSLRRAGTRRTGRGLQGVLERARSR